MASTFTGLKLQGLLGRFGKTTVTDIEGYVELPDGKVCLSTLSHCHIHTLIKCSHKCDFDPKDVVCNFCATIEAPNKNIILAGPLCLAFGWGRDYSFVCTNIDSQFFLHVYLKQINLFFLSLR